MKKRTYEWIGTENRMEYRYSPAGNFEDYASGRVLYGGRGVPNFPVRLIVEIFGRARSRLKDGERLRVYDPCCGGAYALTVLGFFCGSCIGRIYASDISPDMLGIAEKNLGLLTREGLDKRREELERLLAMSGKPSYADALESLERLRRDLPRGIETEVFAADCTKPLPDIRPDVIITDVPYGNLAQWQGEDALRAMLGQLRKISSDDTVLAVCADKSQKIRSDEWVRIEKQNVGKRRFEIFIRN